jgi:hypothetical protein
LGRLLSLSFGGSASVRLITSIASLLGWQLSRIKITRASVATVSLEAIVKAGCWIVKAELANKDINIRLSGLQNQVIGIIV